MKRLVLALSSSQQQKGKLHLSQTSHQPFIAFGCTHRLRRQNGRPFFTNCCHNCTTALFARSRLFSFYRPSCHHEPLGQRSVHSPIPASLDTPRRKRTRILRVLNPTRVRWFGACSTGEKRTQHLTSSPQPHTHSHSVFKLPQLPNCSIARAAE